MIVQELKSEIESTVTMSPGSFNQTGDHYASHTQSLHPTRSVPITGAGKILIFDFDLGYRVRQRRRISKMHFKPFCKVCICRPADVEKCFEAKKLH